MQFKYTITRNDTQNVFTCFMKCASLAQAQAQIDKWNAKNDGYTYSLA